MKSYYAIIPANVRYDKDLPANAKLLYGEITALCNDKGFCWASNSYFAELYEVTVVTISRWIALLKKKGYIEIFVDKKDGNKRYIAIEGTGAINKIVNRYKQNNQDLLTKMLIGHNKNVNRGNSPNVDIDKDRDMKKSSNNTINNTVNNTVNNIELQKNCNDNNNLRFPDDSTEIAIVRFMINELLRVKPNSKVPDTDAKSLQNWAQHIDYMIRLDDREPREIMELFKWAQDNDFWCANIRSPRKLREKWDTLELQKERDKPKGNKNLSKLEEMYRKAKAEEEGKANEENRCN